MSVLARTTTNSSSAIEGPPSLLHGFFERAAARWPERVAVEVPPGPGRDARHCLAYRDLDRLSSAVGVLLREFVAGECVVAIQLPRGSTAPYVAQLGILKAGAAYTSIDSSFPDQRLGEILRDSEAVALITDEAGRARALSTGFDARRVVVLDQQGEWRDRAEELGPAPAWLRPESLAYVIYTSGTTGRPKGVLIEHRSVVNLVWSNLVDFDLNAEDRVAQGSSASYDSSIEETWLAFAAGATLVVMDDAAARLGPDLTPWLRRERVTVFCPPPTLLRATGCLNPESELPGLRLLYVGGEDLPRDVADRWAVGRRMVNGYGPTECTVTALRGRVEAGQPISIGRPVAGASAWVLGETLEVLPAGTVGELALGGVGLARGYWNRAELTAEKFVAHPILGRIYRTGDLVHQDDEGRFYCHGRADAQVKIRGHRVELGEIEARLMEHPGVRAAACRIQDPGGAAALVAFIAPDDHDRAPSPGDLRAWLASVLPSHMTPVAYGTLDPLPTTVGGKLDRAALPWLEPEAAGGSDNEFVAPENELEHVLADAFKRVLRREGPVSTVADFFVDLGGDSLRAAELVSLLRLDPATEWATVRDIYEARSVAELAARSPVANAVEPRREERPPGKDAHPLGVTILQACWLLAGLWLGSAVGYVVAYEGLPWFASRAGLLPLLIVAPLAWSLASLFYVPASIALTVFMKRTLIGTYRPSRTPVWSGFYLRHWVVQRTARLIPWESLEGTAFQSVALRLLGARIGQRVHLDRGVDLSRGGWDLLEIGDGVAIGRDASLRMVDLDDGDLVIAPVRIGAGATLETRSGVGGGASVGAGALLTSLSSLPAGQAIPDGECWDGIPARPAGMAPDNAELTEEHRGFSPLTWSLSLQACRLGLGLALSIPLQLLTLAALLAMGLRSRDIVAWIRGAEDGPSLTLVLIGIAVLSAPLALVLEALIARLLGRVPEGAVGRWSVAFLRVWLTMGIVESAGRWLSGTLFWPGWLRLAGMELGRGCEISTIMNVIPRHVSIGSDTFFADGVYLGGPRVRGGVAELRAARLGTNTFLGNHVVIPPGHELPDNLLLGVCTVADDRVMGAETGWFGHPPFALPNREVVPSDRRLTHDPAPLIYANRVLWELMRFLVPVPALLAGIAWWRVLAHYSGRVSPAFLVGCVAPLTTLGAIASLCFLVLVLKWILLGRVRPGRHAFWSCWCNRWDFSYVAWEQLARPYLSALEGTLLLNWYLRAMGMKIGRRVALGNGFAQVVDPDMITIDDGATVHAMFQAHTFEDRVLKIGPVRIRRGATLGSNTVPLYGVDVGEFAHVAPHGVIMKHERLLPRHAYEGSPTRREVSTPPGA